MYTSFFDEVEKIAFQRSQKGEGSRGGKVIGRTKSGKPIYESSKKDKKPGAPVPAAAAAAPKSKPNWGKRIAIGGAILGTVGLAALGFRKKKQLDKFKQAADRYGKAGGPEAGKAGKAAWDDFARAGDDAFGGHSEWKKAKASYQKGYEAKKAHQKAADAYNKAGGPYTRGKGAEWKAYKKTGDEYYGHRPYGTNRSGNSETYSAREQAWRAGSAKEHAEHEGFKRGKSGWSSARQSTSSTAGAKAYSAIPGLGKVKTKKEAKKLYREAAMKAHPDRHGGSEEPMKRINVAWGDYEKSPLYEKLAMVYWSRMANTMFR